MDKGREHHDTYYEWHSLVSHLLEAYESEVYYSSVIGVEKANHVEKDMQWQTPLWTMEELHQSVEQHMDVLLQCYSPTAVHQYRKYREQMAHLVEPMTRSEEKNFWGDTWKSLRLWRESFSRAMEVGITKETPLLLACSGGVDSIALLHYLYVEGFEQVGVFTMDHGLRDEGKEEVELVELYAAYFGMPCYKVHEHVEAKAVQEKVSFEMMGRTLRYQYLHHILEDYGYEYIVTAHHKDDQAETVLAHLLRGSTLEGLQGMKVLHERIWRPCLGLEKRTIEAYSQFLQCFHGDDITNGDTKYERNWIRHELVPLCKSRFPQFVDTLYRNSQLAQEDVAYLNEQVEDLYAKYVRTISDKEIQIEKKSLKHMHASLIRRLWKRILSPYVRGEQLHQKVLNTLASLTKGPKGKEFFLGQVQVITSYDTIKIILSFKDKNHM